MSEISDLESRISAAMDRISRGLEGLAPPAASEASEDAGALKEAQDALENEKLATAQLEDRVQSLKDKLSETETALAEANDAVEKAAEARDAAQQELAEVQAAKEAEAEAAPTIDLDEERDTIAQLARRLRRLRRTSRQLRSTNQQLREAAEKGLSDPALINQSLAAELDDLQAMRAAEIAEMDVITAALRPMLGDGVADADDGQEDN